MQVSVSTIIESSPATKVRKAKMWTVVLTAVACIAFGTVIHVAASTIPAEVLIGVQFPICE